MREFELIVATSNIIFCRFHCKEKMSLPNNKLTNKRKILVLVLKMTVRGAGTLQVLPGEQKLKVLSADCEAVAHTQLMYLL